jgi:DNA-binding CsgD family transcriptional regulator
VLAEDDDQGDRRAWHLAASAVEPDEEIVRTLEAAAERARARAGHLAAAKALTRAAELSADGPTRGRRLVGAARSARIAGADDFAVALAERARPLVDDPLLRGEIACTIGVAAFRRGRPADGLPVLLDAARDIAPLDAEQALELLIWATGSAATGGHPAALAEVSSVASTIVTPESDDVRAVVQALAGFARAITGDPAQGGGEPDETLAWASACENAQYVFAVGVATLFSGNDHRFGMLANRAISLARAQGELGILAEALTVRAAHLGIAQRFDEAGLAAGEAVQLALELGAVNVTARPLSTLAIVAAIRGDEEGLHRRAAEALEVASEHGLTLLAATVAHAYAQLDLGNGRWAEALGHLDTIADVRPGHGSPFLAAITAPDRIEAAVRTGRPDVAQVALPVFETWASHSRAAWTRPRLASCRALLAEGDEATEHFEAAIGSAADARPLDLARIQLLYGEHLRRERRRTEARVQLRAAVEAFDRLRAEPWAERARAELRATGESAGKRDPSSIDSLTPQELQIARLVAEGLSNKEVAAQLFLSPRTIEFHLRNAFVKLGITSRTQLARFPLHGAEPGAAAALSATQ